MMFNTTTVVVHREKYGILEFMVHLYQWTPADTGVLTPPEPRFISGTNKDFPDETPEQTAARKLLDETGLICEKFNRIDTLPVGNIQTKYGFLVNFDDCGGELHHTGHDREGDVMSHPYWVPALELRWFMRERHPHLWICEAALEELEAVCC